MTYRANQFLKEMQSQNKHAHVKLILIVILCTHKKVPISPETSLQITSDHMLFTSEHYKIDILWRNTEGLLASSKPSVIQLDYSW